MGVTTVLHHFIVSNLLTLYYSGVVLFIFLWDFIKNPFGDPWAQKLRLEPPACLTDPKYGVHKYLKVNNTKLHYVESGDPSKPLMVFLHGFPEFWYSWRYQITEFNKDYWCISVDMRGYGDSEKPENVADYRIELLVEDIRDLVRQLGREKCILVSHDWGGLIACRFRNTYPEVLQAVVVLASTSREAWFEQVWSNPKQRRMSWYVFLYRCPALPEKLLRMHDLRVFDVAMLNKDRTTVDQQDLECYKYWFGKPTALTPPVNYYRANFPYQLPETPQCTKPVPFLYALAEKDVYLSKNLIESMKKQYATIETKVLDGCAHFMQQEEPDRVNALIRQFLAKNKV